MGRGDKPKFSKMLSGETLEYSLVLGVLDPNTYLLNVSTSLVRIITSETIIIREHGRSKPTAIEER